MPIPFVIGPNVLDQYAQASKKRKKKLAKFILEHGVGHLKAEREDVLMQVDRTVREAMRDTDHEALLKIQDLLDGVEWQTITIEHIAEVMVNAGYRIRDKNDNDLRFDIEMPWRTVEGDDDHE